MKNINRQIVKLLTPIFLLALCCACFFCFNNKTAPVLAETTSQVQTVDLTPDENGCLNLEKWEDFTPSSSTNPTAMTLSQAEKDSVNVWGRTLEGTVYKIDSAADLADMAKMVNNGGGENCSFVLNADIDLSGKIWTPIGISADNCFKGKFYGNGHKISGIIIDNSIGIDNAFKHLFGYVDSNAAGIYDVLIETTYGCAEASSLNYSNNCKGCKIDEITINGKSDVQDYGVGGFYYTAEANDITKASDENNKVSINNNYAQLNFNQDSCTGFNNYSNKTITSIKIYEYDWENSIFNNSAVKTYTMTADGQKTDYGTITISGGYTLVTDNNGSYTDSNENTTIGENKLSGWESTHQNLIKIVIEFDYKIVTPNFEFYYIDNIIGTSANYYSEPSSNIYYHHDLSSYGFLDSNNLDNLDGFFVSETMTPDNGSLIGSLFKWNSYTNNGLITTKNEANETSLRYNDKIKFEIDNFDKNKTVNLYTYQTTTTYFGTNTTYEKVGVINGGCNYCVISDNSIKILIFNIETISVKNAITYIATDNIFSLPNSPDSKSMSAYRIFNIGTTTPSLSGKIIYSKNCGIISSDDDYSDFQKAFSMLQVYYYYKSDDLPVSTLNRKDLDSSNQNQVCCYSTIYADWYLKSVDVTIEGDLSNIKIYTSNDSKSDYSYFKELEYINTDTINLTLFYTEKLYLVDENSVTTNDPLSYYYTLSGTNDKSTNNPITLSRDFEYSKYSANGETNTTIGDDKITMGSNDYYAAAVITILQDNSSYELEKCDKKIKDIIFKFVDKDELNLNSYLTSLTVDYRCGDEKKVSNNVFIENADTNIYAFQNYYYLNSNYKVDMAGNINNIFTLTWKSTSRVGMTLAGETGVEVQQQGIATSTYTTGGTLDKTSLNFKITQFNKNNESVTITITLSKTENTFYVSVVDSDGNADFNNSSYKDASKITINGAEKDNIKLSNQGNEFTITYNSNWFTVDSDSITCTVGGTHYVSQIASDNGEGTITITPSKLGAYYKEGVSIVVTLTKIRKTLTLEAENGTIDNSTNPTTIYYYYNTKFSLSISGDKFTLTTTEYDYTSTTYTSTTYTINPKSSHYKYSSVTSINNISNNISIVDSNTISYYGGSLKTKTITVTFAAKTYNVDFKLGYYDSSGEWQGENDYLKLSGLATSFTNGTLTAPSDPAVNYFTFSHYEIVKDNTGTSIVASDGNLITYYKFNSNVDIAGYLSNGKITIRMVYTPILYTFNFTGYDDVKKDDKTATKTTSAADDSFGRNTLFSLLDGDLAKSGYDISGFELDGTTTSYETDKNVKDVITNKENSQTINLTVVYKGKEVTLNFDVKSKETDEDWSTSHSLGLKISGTYGTAIAFGITLQNKVKEYKGGTYKISEYSYDNNIWTPWTTLTEDDTDISFNNFSEGTTKYTIYVRLEKITKTINFDKTYCSEEASIQYDSSNEKISSGTIPTPTRAGFTFLYWGTAAKDVTITKDTTDWKIYYNSQLDEVTLYAYWKFNGFKAKDCSISDNEFTYNGKENDVIIKLPSGSGVSFAWGGISKKEEGASGCTGEKDYSIKDNTLTLSGFKYVAHSGTYTVTLNCSLTDETGAGSSTYITNSSDIGSATIDVEVTIKQATLTIKNGDQNKVYDGTTDVNFTISDVQSDDTISAAYADANVGEKDINYTFANDTNDYIKGSYTGLPKTGTINALEVTVNVSGNVKPSSTNFKLARAKWDSTSKSWSGTNNTYGLTINNNNFEYNNPNAWNKLKNSTTLELEFDIYYNNGLVIENLNCSANTQTYTNIEVKVENSGFSIVTLEVGEKGYVFVAYLDTDTNKESPIGINFTDGSGTALNLTQNNNGQYETTTKTEGDDDTFNVNFGSSYANYWIKQVKVNNEALKSIPTADEKNYFALTITGTATKWTTVEIVITNSSNITFDYMLVEGEEITGSNGNKFDIESNKTATFTYGSSGSEFTLPTGLNRTGFTFGGWSLSKGGAAIDSTTWQTKQTDVTLYAVWEFNAPTLIITGKHTTKEYDGEDLSIELTISNKNKILTYEYSWQKQNGENWEDVSASASEALTVKNVADSGTYRAVLTKVYATVDNKEVIYYEKPKTNSTETPITSNTITVKINEKEISFTGKTITKVFDGFATYEYTVLEDDFADDINNELTGKTIKLTFTFKIKDEESDDIKESDDINVGTYSYGATTGKSLSVETADDAFNNYNINFSSLTAEITQREIKFDIGEQSRSLSNSVWKVDITGISIYDLSKDPSGKTIFDETNVNFKFKDIIVQTNKTFVGVYPDSTNGKELEIGKVTVVDKSDGSIQLSNNNFNFTIAGTFTITRGSLSADDVKISNTDVTYNGKTRNIHVEIVNISSTASFTCKLLDEKGEELGLASSEIQYSETEGKFSADISTGKKDVGEYKFKIKLTSSFYEDFISETITFKINTLSVNINNKKDDNGNVTYSKTYDGTTDVIISTDYFDFTYGSDNNKLGSDLVDEILQNYTFSFGDKNVGTNKSISYSTKDSNYANIAISGNLTGNITQKEIWLKVADSKVYESADKYTIAYNKIEKVVSDSDTTEVVASDIITSGDITITISSPTIGKNEFTYGNNSNYTLNDLVIDGTDISKNYDIKGVCGTITISKAIIKIGLTKTEYEYSAKNAALAISASLQTNAEQPYTTISYSDYLTMTVYNGQGDSISTDKAANVYKNVGSYTARFTFKSNDSYKYSDYYTLEGAKYLEVAEILEGVEYSKRVEYKDLFFEITKKAITINVNKTHYYNGNKAEYDLNAVAKAAGLIDGHTFGNYLQTSYSIYGEYNVNDSSQVYVLNSKNQEIAGVTNAKKIKIYETTDEGEDVSSNYNVTLSGTIKIVVQTAEIQYIDEGLIYNGTEQEIKLKLTLNEKSERYFKVKSEVKGTSYTYTVTQYTDENFNEGITTGDNYIPNVSASVTLNTTSIGFKYAGEYSVKFTVTLNVGSLSANTKATISPKTIKTDNINYTNTKVYDGNTKVSDVSLQNFYSDDANCFNVSAEYSDKNVGSGKKITFTLSEKTTSDYSSYIFNSYTTNNTDEQGNKILSANDGEITACPVTFTYNNSSDHYYTGKALTLKASAFDISGEVNGETFSGTITFNNITNANVNADSYALSSETDIDTLSLEITDSALENYTITFAGAVTIKKAQIVVRAVSNNSYPYDGEGKTATLTAVISNNGNGEIPEGVDANSILTATYVDTNDTDATNNLTEAINAGTYNIYPEIASGYEQNYEYVGDDTLDKKLTINKRNITIKVEQSTYIEKLKNGDSYNNFVYELGSGDVATCNSNGDEIPQLVSGHTLTGTISTNGNSVEKYTYSGTLEKINPNEEKGISLSDLNIYETANPETSVLSNYSITLDITLSITNTLSDGELFIKANNLTYNGNNQWNSDSDKLQDSAKNVFYYEIKDPSITEITFSRVYFFTDKTNAETALKELKTAQEAAQEEDQEEDQDIQNITIPANTKYLTTDLTNAGTYYAIVIYNPTAVYSYVIEVNIAKKTISSLQFNDKTIIDFEKTYDGNADVTGLTSTDILDADKNKFSSITATFYTDSTKQTLATNAGEGYYIGFEFVAETALTTADLNSLKNNYKFENKTGTINQKDVMLSLSKEYGYAGKQEYTIYASDFADDDVVGLIGSDALSGSVTIKVENVGTYDSSCISENGLTITSNGIESNNYTINFESFNVKVKALEVVLSKNGDNLTYTASNLEDDVVENIISVDNTTFEDDIKTQLQKEFYSIFTVKIGETKVKNIKNAATYTLTINQQANSGNFKFAFKTDITSMDIIVEKATLTITLGETTLKYNDYVENKGYTPTEEQVEGLCKDDDIKNIIITINKTIFIDKQYSGDSLTCPLEDLKNNYTATVSGSLTLTYPTAGIELKYDAITYNGKSYDLFNDLKVYFEGEEDTKLYIEKKDNNIEKKDNTQTFSNVYDSDGNLIDYIIYVKVATISGEPIYKELTINVTPKTVSTINYNSKKTYDGTNVVYIAAGNSNLSSTDFVDDDDVYATGTYSSYKVGNCGITFELNGAEAKNYVLSNDLINGCKGEITKKEITIEIEIKGEDAFTYSYKNEYYHKLTKISGLVDGDSLSKAELTFTLEKAGTHTIDKNNNQPKTSIIIKKDNDDVSGCYNFTFTGSITINPKKFSIIFSNTSTTFNNRAQDVTYSIKTEEDWDDKEIENVEAGIKIEYVNKDTYKTTEKPMNAGTYTATVSCTNTNYNLTETTTADFEITKYTYTITKVPYFSRTESDTTPLTQSYNIDFGDNGTLLIVVTFENADSNNTLGDHNIKVKECNNSNIDVVCDKGKLTITPDYTKTLTVTLTSFKENVSNTRQYGMKDIGKFDLSNFEFTCKVDNKTLTNDEIKIIELEGSIFFETGNVGEHGYSLHELKSSYNTIDVKTDLKLKITKRTIDVTAESYNKVFDGTTDFVNEIISLKAVTKGDEFDEGLLPTVTLKYESENVGTQPIVVECSTNFDVVLKNNNDETITTGEISKLKVSISLEDDASSFTYGDLSVTTLEDEKFVDMIEYCIITNDASSKITPEKLQELISARIECKDENISTSNKLNASTYLLTFKNLSEENIVLTQNAASITVTKKEVTLKIKDSSNNLKEISKEQDGTTDIVLAEGEELVLDGIVDGDVVSVDKAQFDAKISEYGENIKINVTTSGADVGNYSIVASGTITRKVIVIKFDYLSENIKGNIISGTSYKEYGYYEIAKEVPSPTHEQGGYKFVGWGKSDDSTDAIDFTKPLNGIFTEYSKEITVYAIWEINKFEIDFVTYKYILDSGYEKDTSVTYQKQTIEYGEEIDIENIAKEIEHYTFAGYCLSETDAKNYVNITTGKHVVEKDVTIYLVYNLNQYSVTFESDVAFKEINKIQSQIFEYSNENKTLKITDYYGRKLGDINNSLSTYLTLEKTGYTFNGYLTGSKTITVENLLKTTILGETTYTAKFTANTYTLTLNANGGTFESLEDGWSYKEQGKTDVITKEITFDSNVLLPEPTRAGYNFGGYTYSDEDVNLTNFVFNFAGNVEFVAKWNENNFTLTIKTTNVEKVFVKYYTSENSYIKTVEDKPTNDSCTFTVSTSNRVEISAEGTLGYKFDKFVIDKTEYKDNSTYKSTADFVENTNWQIIYVANENIITFKVNNDNYGSVGCGIESTSKNKPSISVGANTGTTLTISITAVEGYQLAENWFEVFGENYNLVKIEQSEGNNYVVSGFVNNVEVQIEFVPKDVTIWFEFDSDAVSVLCDSINNSENFDKTTKVEEVITFTLTVNYGYSLESVTFTPSGSKNTGKIEKNDLTYTFTGFTSDGTIKIETKKEEYTTKFILAEFDETNETIKEIINTTEYVANFESKITKEYKEEVSFTPTICDGWKVKCWQIEQDGNYVDLHTQSTYSNVVEKNVSIRLVIERETYTITYTTSNGGSIKNSEGAQMESFTEEVRFGRESKGAEAVAWSNAKFVGWFEGETNVETSATIKKTSDNANHTYVAKFEGETISFVLKIYTNTTREDLTFKNLDNFGLSGEIVTDVKGELTYSSGQQVVVLKAEVVAYSDVTLTFKEWPAWFEIDSSSGNINSDEKIVFAQVKTNSTIENGEKIGSYSVNLKVKTFTITINANNINGIVIKNGSSHINKTDGKKIVVEYGANLVAELNCLKGYMITKVSNVDSFENNIVTINEITSDITCDVSISVSKFKVRFNFNYEGKSQGKQYPDVTNYVYYVYYGQTEFVDENDQKVTLPESIVNPQSKVTDPLVFLWWNSAQNGLGSYNYSFENGKITTTYSGTQKSGFVYDLINSSTDDYIDLTLYAIWNQAKNVVSVEFSPVDYTGDVTTIFGSSTKKFIYNNKIYYVVDATVTINAPRISGYTYYGWKMNGETEINKEYLSFTMPEKDVTVTLYYSFEITVDVKEPIKAGSTATINGKSSENILAGELFTIKATPGKGLAFDYWTVDGVKNESLTQEAVVTSDGKPHKYVAVFKVKTISVSVENTNLVILRTNKTEFGIGETIVVYVDFVADGYKITDVLLNKLGNSFTLSGDKTCYFHTITINDAEIGELIISSVTNLKTYNFKIESNLSGAGTILVNEQNLELFDAVYNFDLNIVTTESARYALKQISVNGVVIKTKQDTDLLNFVITLNTSSKFNLLDESVNIISFEFEKYFWIDSVEPMTGEGTENNPFLIANEKQFAYMAKMLNSGEINQTNTHLYYMLTANLNLEQAFWIPIGTKEHPFNGTFNLNDHTISFVVLDPDQTYEVLAWETKLYGVFGYVTDSAELLFNVSKLPIILVVSISALFVVVMIVVIVIIIVKKKRKIQKLSKKISTETLTKTSTEELTEQELEEFNTETKKSKKRLKNPKE